MNNRPRHLVQGINKIITLRPQKQTLRAPGHRMSNKPQSTRHTKPYSGDAVRTESVRIPKNPAPQFSHTKISDFADIILNPTPARQDIENILAKEDVPLLLDHNNPVGAEDDEIVTLLPSESTVVDQHILLHFEEPIIIDPVLFEVPANTNHVQETKHGDETSTDAGKVLHADSESGAKILTGIDTFQSAVRKREQAEATMSALEDGFFHGTPKKEEDIQEQLFTSNYELYCSTLPYIIANTEHEGDHEHLKTILSQIDSSKNWDALSVAVDTLVHYPYKPKTFLLIDALWKQAKKAGQNGVETGLRDSNDRIFSDFRNTLPTTITVKNGQYTTSGTGSEMACELEVSGQVFALEFNTYHQTITDLSFPHNTEKTPVLSKFLGATLDKRTLKRLETTLLKIAENPDGYISKEPPAPEAFVLLSHVQKIATDFQNRFNATKANPDAWVFIESTIEQGKVVVTARVGEVSETFEVFGSMKKSWFRTVSDFRIHSNNDAISGHAFDKNTLQNILSTLRKDRESFIPPVPKVSFTQKVKSSFKTLWAGISSLAESAPKYATRAKWWLGEKFKTVSSWFKKQPTGAEISSPDEKTVIVRTPQKKHSFFQGGWIRKTAWAGLFIGILGINDNVRRHTPHAEPQDLVHPSIPSSPSSPSSSSTPTPVPAHDLVPSTPTQSESFSMAESRIARRGREGTMIDFLRHHGIH